MTKQERYEAVSNAMTTKERDIDETIKDAMLNIQHDIEAGDFDLSYEIMASACGVIADIDLSDLNEAELNETETASVYTATRLSYANNSNQSDISDIAKEYNVDFATACAVWYDNQVRNACEQLRDYIINGGKNDPLTCTADNCEELQGDDGEFCERHIKEMHDYNSK